jgi:ATP-dependent RNA helicase HelY
VQADYPVTKILSELNYNSLLPAILFRSSRRQCDTDVEKLSETKSGRIPKEDSVRLISEIETILEKYGFQPEVIYEHVQYQTLVETAVGAHHAGQLLAWRLLLEELMSRGLLRIMIATGTVAAGVDFPARTVVITSHSKRGSEGFGVLLSSELQQMAGRAGRRGKDTVGICLVAPSMFSDARVIHEVSKRPAEALRSAYFASPSTVLNLLKFRNVDDLRYTVSRSLAAFHDRKVSKEMRERAQEAEAELQRESRKDRDHKKDEKRVRRLFRDADELENKQSSMLEKTLERLVKLKFVEGSGLSEKGYWAADLCTTLVLELAEAIQDGVFHDLGSSELAALVASLAGDQHRNYFNIKANPIKKEYFTQLETVLQRVKDVYEGETPYEVAVLPDAALTILTWIDCRDWSEFNSILKLSGVAAGDAARLVSQTADHLNQITRLSKSHPVLAQIASEARKKILKPPLSEAMIID